MCSPPPVIMMAFFLLFCLCPLFILVRTADADELVPDEGKMEKLANPSADDETKINNNNADDDENADKPEFTQENGIYVLTEANFDKFLLANPTALIEFYAPWCGHCKQLAPEYEKAAQQLGGSVPLAKVDATVEKELAQRFGIQGFPTLKFWRKDLPEPIDYDGSREAKGIVEWLRIKTDPDYAPPPEEVVALTRETFDEFVGNKPIMLLEFYAPWCGHCKRLAPELEKAAQRLKEHQIPIAKVDATVEKKLAEEYAVQGYPTLKILRNGRRFDYNGPREADGIVQHMLEQAEPAARLLSSPNDQFMGVADVSIVGFFEADNGPLFDAFVDAAERTRGDFNCAYVTDPAVIAQFNAKPGQIVLFYPQLFSSKYEKSKMVYPKSEGTTEELLTFYRENATPLVGQMTRKNSATRYAKRPLVVVYYNVDFTPAYRDGSQYWRNKVVEIANKYKDKNYHFAVADEEEFAQELNSVGLGTSGLEQNVVVFGADGKKYPMDPDIYDEDGLTANLKAFLADIGKGKAKPHVKSQPLPKEDKTSAVRTLVASNFDRIVNDESKDVLIEFYAPWCGHCKAFEPKYKQFAAKHAKEQPHLLVAKFDATENDLPSWYTVEGFPTIYLAPAGKQGKKKPVKYNGSRDLDDLAKFVRDNSVKSFQENKEEKDEL